MNGMADAFARGVDGLGPYPADRAKIEAVSMLFEDSVDNPALRAHLCNVLLVKLMSVPDDRAVPVLYLLDFIVKKVGEGVLRADLAPRLRDAFAAMLARASTHTRDRMVHTLNTWDDMNIFAGETADILVHVMSQPAKRARLGAPPQRAHAGAAFTPAPAYTFGTPAATAAAAYSFAQPGAYASYSTAQPIAYSGAYPTAAGIAPIRHVLRSLAPAAVDELPGDLKDITPAIVASRDMRPVRILYDQMPHQCKLCALRFATPAELAQHQAEEAAQVNARGVSVTPWALSANVWVRCRPRELDLLAQAAAKADGAQAYDLFAPMRAVRATSAEDDGAMSSSDSEGEHVVPVTDADDGSCAACGDALKKTWDADREGWVYLGAVRQNGMVYHTGCAYSSTRAPVKGAFPPRP